MLKIIHIILVIFENFGIIIIGSVLAFLTKKFGWLKEKPGRMITDLKEGESLRDFATGKLK